MKKFVLASLIGSAVMFAQTATPAAPPATKSAPQTESKTSEKTTKVAKHHHKKSTKNSGTAVNSTATPAPAK